MAETRTERLSKKLTAKKRIEIPDLPFIKKRKDQIVFWSVKPSYDYVKDCQMGREYAALAWKYMVEADFGPLLTWCIMDMSRKRDCSGIEVGFLELFAEIATSNFIINYKQFDNLAN